MLTRSFRQLVFAFGLLFYAASLAAAPRTLVVLGDSLSAAYGMDTSQGWVYLLAERVKREGYDWRVVNASVSGETTGGGVTRLPSILAVQDPDVIIIALGGNDGLRGLPLERMRDNLMDMADTARAAGARVVLVGLRIPPNYGPHYTRRFQAVYEDVAAKNKLPLVPFLLHGVDENAALMQPDRVHAAPAAQAIMLDNVWPAVEPLLK